MQQNSRETALRAILYTNLLVAAQASVMKLDSTLEEALAKALIVHGELKAITSELVAA